MHCFGGGGIFSDYTYNSHDYSAIILSKVTYLGNKIADFFSARGACSRSLQCTSQQCVRPPGLNTAEVIVHVSLSIFYTMYLPYGLISLLYLVVEGHSAMPRTKPEVSKSMPSNNGGCKSIGTCLYVCHLMRKLKLTSS